MNLCLDLKTSVKLISIHTFMSWLENFSQINIHSYIHSLQPNIMRFVWNILIQENLHTATWYILSSETSANLKCVSQRRDCYFVSNTAIYSRSIQTYVHNHGNCHTLGSKLNTKKSYQYRSSHCGDKTILRSSYLHNGHSYTDRTPFCCNWPLVTTKKHWQIKVFFTPCRGSITDILN